MRKAYQPARRRRSLRVARRPSKATPKVLNRSAGAASRSKSRAQAPGARGAQYRQPTRAASWFGFVRAWLPVIRSSQFACAFSQPTSAGAAYSENVKLGIISDTHGLLRPEVLSALRGPAFSGIDRILHCGDVGKASILHELAK